MAEPYVWEWTEDGIRRQTVIHVTQYGNGVQWAPRHPGDELPWFDAEQPFDSNAGRFADEDLITLGMPVTAWSGFPD